jgi:ABC-type antimicrobial peptide transport system permease subunit
MPGPSDAAANEWLELVTQAGGADWEIVLLSTLPDSHSTGGTVITDFDPQPVPRDSSTWSTPASRQTHMLTDVDFGVATIDSVPVAWLIRDAAHNPVHSCLLAGGGLSVVTGSPVGLAGSQVTITIT